MRIMQNSTKNNLINPVQKIRNFDLSIWLPKKWTTLTWWHLLLTPLSWVFQSVISVRKWLYQAGFLKSFRLSVPVIVVGNINVGGTGKTPLVIYLAEQLESMGYKPGIISRGYGGNAKEVRSVEDDSNAMEVGDEPLLIARRTNCPVYVSQDRLVAAQALLDAHPACDIIISDDGLQHYRLQRDVEIVVVDGAVGFGNGALFPAGPLRESVARLNTVDAIVVNGLWVNNKRLDDVTLTSVFDMQLKSTTFYNLAHTAQVCGVDQLHDKKIVAIAGIGNPTRFFNQLEALGLTFKKQAFPDHYEFQAQDLTNIKADVLVMTEKDAVKCQAFSKDNYWVLPVKAELDEDFLFSILNKLDSIKS
jgi:tetraacyldisaccharide 4'-kinase